MSRPERKFTDPPVWPGSRPILQRFPRIIWPGLIAGAAAITLALLFAPHAAGEVPSIREGGEGTSPSPRSRSIAGKDPSLVVTAPPAEDLDGDGAFDVFEDFNRNGRLDEGEDRDGDDRLTPPGGCEGRFREDADCDGHLDRIDEDFNGNGVLDPGEDIDGDGRLDDGTEDFNENQILDDRPLPSFSDLVFDRYGMLDPLYPYGSIRPSSGGLTISLVTPEGDACQCVTASRIPRWAALVEDPDADGAFDVFEDFQGNGDLFQDRDGDGRITPPGGCEGLTREDIDCDGNLDFLNEDFNDNGVLDPGEDIDGDGRLDPFIDTDGDGFSNHEDRNRNQYMDDHPFISFTDFLIDEKGNRSPFYPYGISRPGLGGLFNSLMASKDAVCDCGKVFTVEIDP